MLRFFTSCKN